MTLRELGTMEKFDEDCGKEVVGRPRSYRSLFDRLIMEFEVLEVHSSRWGSQ